MRPVDPRTPLWAALLLLAVWGPACGPAEAPRADGTAAREALRVPARATAGVPVAVGVVPGTGTLPERVCFAFGDGSARACARRGFVSHAFAAPGRYRVEAEWPGCGDSCRAVRDVEVTSGEAGRFLFRAPVAAQEIPFLDIPFPNDLYRDPLAGGVRIGNLRSVLPVNERVLASALPDLQGFGTSTAVYFPLRGEGPDPEPCSEVARSGHRFGSPVFLINVDPGSPEYGTRRPVECAFNPSRDLLVLRPKSGYPLLPETLYAAVVTTSLWNRLGGYRADPGMEEVLRLAERAFPSPAGEQAAHAAVGRVRSIHEPALRRILSEPDIPEPGVLAAVTVFSTQPTVRHLEAIRRQLQARPVPQVRWTGVYDAPGPLSELLGPPDGHAHVLAVAHGRFRTEIYQTPDEGIFRPDDQRFRYDADGDPVVQRAEEIDVTLVLPKRTGSSGAGTPVVIFQHGIAGNRVRMLDVADRFAEAGFAMAGIDAVAHGSRSFWAASDTVHNRTGVPGPDGFPDETPFSQVSAAEFFAYLLNGPAIRDNFRQTAVDLMQLVRLLRNPELDLSPFPGSVLSTESLYLLGDSLGSMFSVLLLAVEPSVSTAALNVGGGMLLTELVGRSPETVQWVLPFLPLLYGVPGDTILDPLDPLVNLLQTVIDPGDPINLAPFVVRAKRDGGRSIAPPTNLLQIMVEGDETVSNESNEALARALGLPLLEPLSRPVPGLEAAASPLRGNRADGGHRATAALVQCSPACHGDNLHSPVGERVFVPGFPYPPGYDVAFPRLPVPVPVRQPYREVQAQIVHFFTSHRETGTAEIRSFWTPVLDWDDDGLPDELERRIGTDPHRPDTDGDGIPDGGEVAAGTDPLDPNDPPRRGDR